MMSIVDLNRLTQPELLSKHELCQILQNSCIEIKDFEKLSRIELIEIYKRVAMPLPQRQHGDRKNKEESKNNMNGNSESEEWNENMTENPNSSESDNMNSTNLCEKRKKIHQENLTNLSTSSTDETKSVSKKIRLSTTTKVETDCNGVAKHKVNEKNEDFASTPMKKRQKITWP